MLEPFSLYYFYYARNFILLLPVREQPSLSETRDGCLLAKSKSASFN